MVAPKVVSYKGKRTPKPQQDFVVATPPSILSSYYILLIVKILLVLIILFTLPKLVTATTATTATTTETAMTMIKSTTKERRRNSHHPQSHHPHSIYQRYKYKLRSLRDDCQNNPNQPCAILIPEESLNCVNECMSVTCYQQVYHSTTTPTTTTTTTEIMEHPPNDIATTTTIMMIRLPLENGEIDVARAKEFDLCVMHELRQAQLQPRTASSE